MAPRATVGIPFAAVDESYLRLAVRSVFAQTERDWELILWSDGAPDHLTALVSSIEDPRVRVERNRPGIGLAATLNEIAAAAGSEVLFRMDSDDVMMPERLERTLAHLRARPAVDLVATRAVLIDEHSRPHGLLNESEEVGDLTRAVLRNPITHPTVAGRTEWFRRHPYSSRWARTEDKHLWQTAGPDSTVEKLSDPLLAYRIPERIDRSKIRRTRREDRRLLRAYGPDAVGKRDTRRALVSSAVGGIVLGLAAGTPLEKRVYARKALPFGAAEDAAVRARLDAVASQPVPGWEATDEG